MIIRVKYIGIGLILCALTASSCKSKKLIRKQSTTGIEHKETPPANTESEAGKTKTSSYPASGVDLHTFIDQWIGVPHRMGGNSTRGVDCSGFVLQVYSLVYNDNFKNRRARDLYLETIPLKRSELMEGDLVFFKIRHNYIDHVGIYLKNGEFVHVSSSKGVMISSLNEAYFSKYFYAGGRKKS